MKISPVKFRPMSEVLDFKDGPFSNKKEHPIQKRQIILEKILEAMAKYPARNAASITQIKEQLAQLKGQVRGHK